MFAEPQAEHNWLQTLVGRWTFDSDCIMGPDQEPSKSEGSVMVRTLGGLWVIADCEGSGPDGSPWNSILTLGYDPAAQRYLGTFIGSMMTHLWLYSGSVDASGKRLVLDTEGPSFNGGGMVKYQDIVEIVSDDHWILSSQLLGDDGKWQVFMTAHHRRQ